jgi:type IV pilus assembly protein PilM
MAAGPKIACEIGVDRVVAGRAAAGGALDQHSVRRLPSGALAPGLNSPNILQSEALRDSISGALSAVGGSTRDVIAILPDAAVRVLLVDFDSLPDNPAEAGSIIRFRVKKSLPFDVDQAALSFHAQRATAQVRVVAALSPRAVIDEYEAAFHTAGYQPGIVVPSILASLGLVDGQRPTMVVKIDANTTSVAIVDRGELVLLRTLDHPGKTELSAQELANAIHPSMVFFEDNYSSKIEAIYLAGMAAQPGLAPELQSETGTPCEYLTSGEPELTGVAGVFSTR